LRLSAKEAMMLTPGMLMDLVELERERRGMKRKEEG
jgi:hypothetical protein